MWQQVGALLMFCPLSALDHADRTTKVVAGLAMEKHAGGVVGVPPSVINCRTSQVLYCTVLYGT